jgi:hypothetical protein
LLPASGGTGATTAAGAWASITNGSQTGSGTSQLNTLPGTSAAVNFNFTGDSIGAIGVVTANSSWYLLSSSIGYGVSTNANGGLDIMANQNGQSVRLWAGTANTAPTEVASFLNTGSVIYENLQVQGTLNNANGPVIPQTALGTQGPAAGYVQLAPSATGTPGYLYDNGSGTRSWNPFTTVQASVASSNVTMTTAGTYYDGPTTGSQAAGTWLIQGTVSLQTSATPTAAINFTCKLWDGTTVFSSTGDYIELTAAGATKDISLSLSAVATEAGAATFKISCTSDTASQLILYQTAYGSVANASSISAVRIK